MGCCKISHFATAHFYDTEPYTLPFIRRDGPFQATGRLLPKNPAIADMLIRWALERKYPGFQLEPLADTLENRAHTYMEERLRAAQNR